MSTPLLRPQHVLVIGGGPSGLVALRNLLERGDFERVELVERRDDIGGVWYLEDPSSRPRWPSPAYPGLIGNVLSQFLSFSGSPFPRPSSPAAPYPTIAETHAYLRAFAAPLIARGHIRLNTEVVSVDEVVGGGWKVALRDWTAGGEGGEREDRWDAVVIATAWYDNPIWSKFKGLQEARDKGLAKHAKWWSGPQEYKHKRVVVIGNGNSSNDIAAQLAPLSKTPVYRSIRHPTITRFVFLPDLDIVDVAPVARCTISPSSPTTLTVHLTDGSAITDVDNIIVGTGYGTSVPFLRVLSSATQTLAPLTSPAPDPPRIPSLHRQILYAPNPSLAFIGAVVSATPFVLADLSSTWLALAWSGSVTYPSTPSLRLESEKERLEELRHAQARAETESALTAYHVLGDLELPYATALYAEIVQARPDFNGVVAEWEGEWWKAREGMYATKYESLRAARDEGRGVGNLVGSSDSQYVCNKSNR